MTEVVERTCTPECGGNGWISCWQCGGSGGFHNCGEDCCACLDDEEVTERCDECQGRGGWPCPVCGEPYA